MFFRSGSISGICILVALFAILSCVTIPPNEFAQGSHGMIIPLYIYPSSPVGTDAWTAVAEILADYPTLSIIAIVNPANGPGERVDNRYRRSIRRLVDRGVVVVGYVATTYGARPLPEVVRDIERWDQFYPGLTGIFFDEVEPGDDTDAWERDGRRRVAQAVAVARQSGYPLIIGNTGRPVAADHFAEDLFDIVIIYENNQWPPASAIGAGFPTARGLAIRSGALIYGDSVWDKHRFVRAAGRLGYIFVNDHTRDMTRASEYAWNYLPDNLDEQAAILASRIEETQ